MEMKKYLVIIDMQGDFIDGALGTAEARAALPHVIERIQAAQKEGRGLLFTQDTHDSHYLETHEGKNLPVPHCVEGTEGWALAPALEPYAAQGRTLPKPTFGSTALVELIRPVSQGDGANLDIELCGVCTDICVVSNALLLRAFFPEARLSLHADACAATTPAQQEAALAVMRACQVEIR